MSQLIVRPSRRGGVPVFRRPRGNPKLSSRSAKGMAGLSPMRPPGRLTSPIWIRPRRNVPVVKTTVWDLISLPSGRMTPCTVLPFMIRSETSASITSKPSQFLNSACMAARYRARSAWVRGPWTAGPLRRFNRRNWMPDLSATRPMTPSRASTSRTRWPLPNPPMAGLQDISPMVSKRWVINAVHAPARHAACAASAPACPPPITMTS